MGKTAAGKIVEAYLDRLHEIHRAAKGTKELSYRSALENLFTQIGDGLDPKIQATGELADTGSGRPDFGFSETKSGNMRGVVETKAPADDVPQTADGAQVAKYWKQYRIVLVTNYRDFLLVACDADNKPRVEGRYSLAADEEAFWRTKPKGLSDLHEEGLKDFLIGAMKRSAPIVRPKDLADDLARHAREAKRRLQRHDMSALAPLKEAMETALGLHFEGKEGEDFFRSSLVQTLFYGLFSGWMLWRQDPKSKGPFDWKDAGDHLALPLIGNLYEEIARPTRLRDLDLREPLEWATTSLNRIVPAEFFKNFDQDHAITLFYEPFLEAFDPHLRKELGVWYTPPEIVKYMVGRVDQLLRSELGITDGLADESVYVLDPAAGTGSYVVEVARKIHQTLTQQGHGALAATKTKKALTTRVFGFEILPAPYVVAHLQLGVLLKELGTKLGAKDRCGVFLTNALTGWEPPKGAKQTLAFPFLSDEQEAANKIKRSTPILVILGNPPYNGFAGIALEEEADLIAPYKEGLLEKWGIRKQLMDDLYVRFFRLAQKRIGEGGPRGVVSYISNSSWLDGLSHPVMRARIIGSFDRMWIDNCNRDKYRTGKRTPDGKPDQSMFTSDSQPVGIQVGTAIVTLVKTSTAANRKVNFAYRDLWGTGNAKRQDLLDTLSKDDVDAFYETLTPSAARRWLLMPGTGATSWDDWPSLPELFPEIFKGVQPGRGGSLVSIDRNQLLAQMADYLDGGLTNREIGERYPELMATEARYDPSAIRADLLRKKIAFDEEQVIPVAWLPFDNRWIYWEGSTKLLNEKRAEFRTQVHGGNFFLACTQKTRKGEFSPPLITALLGSYYVFDPYTTYLPLWVHHEDLRGVSHEPNVSRPILEALGASIGISPFLPNSSMVAPEGRIAAESLFFHALAIQWSPEYREVNADALRPNWPRIPLPADAALLESSAKLGRAVADLLLPDKPVTGVTTGKLRPELRTLAVPTKIAGGTIDEGPDTKVDAGWGFHGQKNAVMCGKGNVTPHVHDPENTVDVWINDSVYWANVPKDVWAMTIGGYPVIKKWLSYREHKILARPLKIEELTYITEVVRRLKALLLLGPDLDANYKASAAAPQISIPKQK